MATLDNLSADEQNALGDLLEAAEAVNKSLSNLAEATSIETARRGALMVKLNAVLSLAKRTALVDLSALVVTRDENGKPTAIDS